MSGNGDNFLTFLRELRERFDEDHGKGKFVERPTLSVAATGRRMYIDLGTIDQLLSLKCFSNFVYYYDSIF